MHEFKKYAMPGMKADYTMTLGELIASGFDTEEKLHLSENYWPLYDESHRGELTDKIVAHYALREIGAETPGQFVFYVGRTLNENAPAFNELYKTLAQKYDMLDGYDSLSETSQSSSTHDDTSQRQTTGSSQKSRTTSGGESFNAQIPATGIQGALEKYASEANKNSAQSDVASDSTNQGDSTGTTDTHATGQASSHSHGRQQSAPSLLAEYRRNIINVDMMVIDLLEPCFMQIYGSDDNVTIDKDTVRKAGV